METNQTLELITKIVALTTGIIGTILSIRLTIISSKEKNKLRITEPLIEFTDSERIVISGDGCKKNNVVILINQIFQGACYIQENPANPIKNGCWSASSKLDLIKNDRFIYALSIPTKKYGQFRAEFENHKNLQLKKLEKELQRLKIKYEFSSPKRMNRIPKPSI